MGTHHLWAANPVAVTQYLNTSSYTSTALPPLRLHGDNNFCEGTPSSKQR
jgi:hypothetical protein